MLDSAIQRLDNGARIALPFFTTLFCLFLGATPWPLPHFGSIAPPIILIALYYWSIHRPDLFRPSMAFIFGILNDIIHNLPIGISAITFVCAYHVILMQRRYFTNQSFLILWTGFIILVVAMQLMAWLLISTYTGQFMSILPLLIQTLLVAMIFPIPCWIFVQIQRLALSQG